MYDEYNEWWLGQIANSTDYTSGTKVLSLLDMFNIYVSQSEISSSDQQFLRARIQADLEIHFSASMHSLAAGFGGSRSFGNMPEVRYGS